MADVETFSSTVTALEEQSKKCKVHSTTVEDLHTYRQATTLL